MATVAVTEQHSNAEVKNSEIPLVVDFWRLNGAPL